MRGARLYCAAAIESLFQQGKLLHGETSIALIPRVCDFAFGEFPLEHYIHAANEFPRKPLKNPILNLHSVALRVLDVKFLSLE